MSEYSAVDISKFHFPETVEILSIDDEFERLKSIFLEEFPEAAEELEIKTEPLYNQFRLLASESVRAKAKANDDARQNTLAHSWGTGTDNFAFNLGVVRVDGESDDNLKGRAILAQEKLSTAGPEGMYVAHAIDAAPNDVKGVKPIKVNNDGLCRIYILAQTGSGIPTGELLAQIHAYVEERIPLCSSLETVSAEVPEYTIEAELRFYPGTDRATALADCRASLETFTVKQHALGRDITLHGIQGALADPRVQNAIIAAPVADIVCSDHQAAYCSGITLTDGGYAL
ncbi:Phage-related baseplate assembly protein [Aliiroseovarius crassostreae]|uniref:Uncharacterized protein n=1 Tax=Aliiroseovarius crassostreae TaxID=154981 RepID=A0A0P7JS55_9RHOB|nr:baseplate J/gp47 family protein [Aliiroseovarius crassostreae]KPN64252.1 hypothetical protein AKJ29_16590 [Aliiroseovarius crassostreae]SFU30974.1 Phage-related baseplate assembly protein [Aliiroseovarius crassostreae]